ncbi:MAG: hypothetical protein IT518_23935 [Burkholderiales bacterium]|nr:hypothetical protein [Burkholderiales bacterium]
MGSVAPTPLRARVAEVLLRGRMLTREGIADVAASTAASTNPSSNGQGSTDCRCEMTGVWVRRLLEPISAK